MKKWMAALFLLASCSKIFDLEDYQPAGVSKSVVFDLQGFEKIEISSAMVLNVKQGPAFKIEASGDQRDIDDLVVKVKNKTLQAYYTNNKWNLKRLKTEVTITMPTLNSVDLSGAVEAHLSGFGGEELLVKLGGASKLLGDLAYQTIDAAINGASNLDISGSATKRLFADLNGASKLESINLLTEKAELRLKGASRAEVHVSKTLDVVASGASKIKYKGEPTITKDLSGASTLEKY